MMLPFLMWQVRIKAMLIGVDSAIYSISLLWSRFDRMEMEDVDNGVVDDGDKEA
jgi:hypothetical protein